MMNVDKNQITNAEATRVRQVTTKQIKGKDICATIFISESDRLTRYCTRFSSSSIQDISESLLEIKKTKY